MPDRKAPAPETSTSADAAPAAADDLSFAALRAVNARRSAIIFPGCAEWNLFEWTAAMTGEAGEALNIAKKIRRGDFDDSRKRRDEAYAALAKELADVVCYADLIAGFAGIDLGQAVRQKWNEVSEKHNWPVWL